MNLDFDRLVAHRVLGRGAMGTVFLVSDRSRPSAPPFALKVVDKTATGIPRAAGSRSRNTATSSCNSSSTTTNSRNGGEGGKKKPPDAERRARWEIAVLSRLSHAFLPTLMGRVESNGLLGWALPYCPGGDLNSLRQSQPDGVFSASAVRFYASEVVAALGHLHSMRIVYRDLKPENVLVQRSGHLTLTDFDLSRYLSPLPSCVTPATTTPVSAAGPAKDASGAPLPAKPRHRRRRTLTRLLFPRFDDPEAPAPSPPGDRKLLQLKKAKSARVSPVGRRRPSDVAAPGTGGWAGERSNSFVGTEEYVAPEVVRGDGHDFAVDWWALGVLVYEMAYGRTPFRGKSRKETFRNVLARPPEFAGKKRDELTDLVTRLLEKDPTRRLGYQGGVEEVKQHPFFKGVQWDMLAEVGRPPYLAPCDDDEEDEAAAWHGGYYGGAVAASMGSAFDIRDYFEKQRWERQAKVSSGTGAEAGGGRSTLGMGSPMPSSVSLTAF